VRKAAWKAKNMLLELAAKKIGEVKPEDLEIKGREIHVKEDPKRKMTIKEIVKNAMPMFDSCVFWTEAPIIAWVWHNQGIWGNSLHRSSSSVDRPQFIEQEVDTETGMIRSVENWSTSMMQMISPETVEGQMYGAVTWVLAAHRRVDLGSDRGFAYQGLLDYKYSTKRTAVQLRRRSRTGLGHGLTEPVVSNRLQPLCRRCLHLLFTMPLASDRRFPITPDKVLAALAHRRSDEKFRHFNATTVGGGAFPEAIWKRARSYGVHLIENEG
jgi:hypothetical protein